MNPITIVMYHYVRELSLTRYPRINALLTSSFVEQLDYMQRYYEFVTVADCIAAVNEGGALPRNAALLTFDDGYLDHFTNVFPLLEKRGIQGCFFPPAKAILEHCILDVNKIHYILASCAIDRLKDDIFSQLDEMRSTFGLESNESYYARLATYDRFDSRETVFVKKLLQYDLPVHIRQLIINRLFKTHVAQDERAFASEVYLSVDQIGCMLRHGMFFGSHGYEHYWMDKLTPAQQAREVDLSLEFLGKVGAETNDWVMCFPYGAHDQTLLKLLKDRGCKLGLTTEPGIAELTRDKVLTLARLDTNDLPKAAAAEPNKWTRLVID